MKRPKKLSIIIGSKPQFLKSEELQKLSQKATKPLA
jgi:hypothetical protein